MQEFGLALGGGGTKGAYHIGVWKALTEMNIKIICITGTSIGSINGALIAQGDASTAEKLWNNISISNIIELSDMGNVGNNLFDAKNIKTVLANIYKNNGLETVPLRNLLEDIINEDKLRASQIDFGLVTYSLDGLSKVELFINEIPKGQLIDYLMASSSLPGLKSTVIDNKKYIDGAVANNIPSDMILKKNINNIITVDVGGVGIVRSIQNTGINIVNIKCSENVIGHLEFREKSIEKMMRLGYFDCMKAFGRLEGEIYSFNISDYHKARLKFSKQLLSGLERAAQIFGIERLKIYTVDSLIIAVVEIFNQFNNDNEDTKGLGLDSLKPDDKSILLKLSKHILNNDLDIMANKIFAGLLGDTFNAANAIVYFFKLIYVK